MDRVGDIVLSSITLVVTFAAVGAQIVDNPLINNYFVFRALYYGMP